MKATWYGWDPRTFIIGLVILLASIVVAMLPLLHGFGFIGMVAGGLWSLYRIIKGGLRLLENKPIDDATAFI